MNPRTLLSWLIFSHKFSPEFGLYLVWCHVMPGDSLAFLPIILAWNRGKIVFWIDFYVKTISFPSLGTGLPRQGKQFYSSNVYSYNVVYPEIMVMVDFSLYQKFSYSIAETRQYIIAFFNSVNSRSTNFWDTFNLAI